MIYETFREAVQNIWSNKFRTFLTMLGIIIGVTAVIVIVGLGNGMTQSIASSFADLGTNIISQLETTSLQLIKTHQFIIRPETDILRVIISKQGGLYYVIYIFI